MTRSRPRFAGSGASIDCVVQSAVWAVSFVYQANEQGMLFQRAEIYAVNHLMQAWSTRYVRATLSSFQPTTRKEITSCRLLSCIIVQGGNRV